MIRIAALENQKSLRDLAGLSKLCDEVAWCDTESLATMTDPAIVVGLWLFEDPAATKKLLEKRSEAGLATIVVPRFKTGDLQAVLNAPSAVNLKTGEYDAFLWDDGSICEVPGQTVIETSLHKGQWGEITGLGVTVLSYRRHEAAGAIVICTASLTSRRFGVRVNGQSWLLERIIGRISGASSQPRNDLADQLPQTASSVEELLADRDPTVAAVVLAVALNEGKYDHEEILNTLRRMEFDLSSKTISQTLVRLPETPVDELENSLRKNGWGAFLRRGRLILAEGGNA